MRKIFGALLILLAIFLSLSIFALLVQLLLNANSALPNDGSPHAIGYIVGTFIGMAIFALLNLAIYFIGFRLLRKKKALVLIPDEDFPSRLKP
ncbi:MAG: hypothetical protein EOO98_04090 [Pedobacter sp.]|nr:MAG: hypothetical protein EOO98_04090 [Pedobacter sp.]